MNNIAHFALIFLALYGFIITVQAVRLTLSTNKRVRESTAREAEARRIADPLKHRVEGKESDLKRMEKSLDDANAYGEFLKRKVSALVDLGMDSTDRRTRSRVRDVYDAIKEHEERFVAAHRPVRINNQSFDVDPSLIKLVGDAANNATH